jgi:hypothetical protein
MLRGVRESWSSLIDGLILHGSVSKSREKRGGECLHCSRP